MDCARQQVLLEQQPLRDDSQILKQPQLRDTRNEKRETPIQLASRKRIRIRNGLLPVGCSSQAETACH